MSVLDRLKIRLNITDTTADAEINALISITENKLKLKYNWTTIPDEYAYIVELTVYCLMRVKKKLGITLDDTTKNDTILESFDDASDEILTYCNRDYLQEGMEVFIIDIMYLLINQPFISSTGSSTVTPTGDIKKVSEGDTSVEYASKSSSTSSRTQVPKTTAEDFLQDIAHKLNNFRRFNWN